ncbi:MAG TPA: glycerol-3-phosphate 1-O-acyltransferase PlsY [Bacteroidales bacterium]
MNYTLLVCSLMLAYLLGSVPSAVWIGKWFYDIDVRKAGSGNAGATNTIRVLGLKAGIPVLLIDAFKGWLAVALAGWMAAGILSTENLILFRIAAGAIAVLGHVFPAFAGFRGGKGVATLVGVVIALYWPAFILVLIWFAIVFAITRYVSLASVTSALIFPFIVLFVFHEQSAPLIVLAFLVAVFIPITHRRNIGRLIRGEENKLEFKKK